MRGRSTSVASLAALALWGAACAGESGGTAILLDLPGDGSVPSYGTAPYPSDAWMESDGTMAAPHGIDTVIGRDSQLVAEHLDRLDGAGKRPLIEFPVDGLIDPSTLGAGVMVVDSDGVEVPYQWRFVPDRLVIAGSPEPGIVLEDGGRYVALVTRDVLDANGDPLVASPALTRLRSSNVPARWQSTAEEVVRYEHLDLAAITVFTVQRATRTLAAARALLDDPAEVTPAELSFPRPEWIFAGDDLDVLLGQATRFEDGPRAGQERWGSGNTVGIAHDHVGVVATGMIDLTRFRRPDDGSDSPADETFVIAPGTGAPEVVGIDSIPITFILPADPPPNADGYPVVVLAHGLGSSRHAALTFAEPLTRSGYVIVAIDADGHGSRASATDERNNLAKLIPDFTGSPDVADGFGDRTGVATTFDFLEGLRNFSGARDAIAQTVLDHSQVVNLLRAGVDLSALADFYGGQEPILNTTRIAFLGESFGTIVGSILAAIEPHVDLFVLDVAAAGMIDLSIVNAPGLATLVVPLSQIMYGIEGDIDRFHPAVNWLQSIMDAADPMSYAPHVLRDRLSVGGQVLGPRHVVVLEVVGDEVIPNIATDALARAYGLEILAPHLERPTGLTTVASPASGNFDGQTAVMVEYAPASHGSNWSSEVGYREFVPGFPHDGDEPFPRLEESFAIANPIYETLEQVVGIVDSHRDGLPVVHSTLPPVADFDDDGMTDDDEIAAGRDPWDPRD